MPRHTTGNKRKPTRVGMRVVPFEGIVYDAAKVTSRENAHGSPMNKPR